MSQEWELRYSTEKQSSGAGQWLMHNISPVVFDPNTWHPFASGDTSVWGPTPQQAVDHINSALPSLDDPFQRSKAIVERNRLHETYLFGDTHPNWRNIVTDVSALLGAVPVVQKLRKGLGRDPLRRESASAKVECITPMCVTRFNNRASGSDRCTRCRWLESQGVHLFDNRTENLPQIGTGSYDWSNRLTALEQGKKVHLDGSYFHDGVGRELQLPEHLWVEK